MHIAREWGYMPDAGNDYDVHNLLLDEIIVDPTFVSAEAVPPVPRGYNPAGEMLEYFKTLFRPEDYVGYCVQSFQDKKDGKWKPAKTIYRRTAGDIIAKLESGSIEQAVGTSGAGGAWVRFNPLNGKGETDDSVTRFKHCLIESDDDSVEKQYSLIKAMNLPVTFLIHSGGKSLHALVRIDAENQQQYRQRVRDLYDFCKKSGFKPDEQDKNASRLSRLPGIKRGDRWQYIVARNIGAASYDDWIKWREESADDLPPDEYLSDVWDNMPPLKEELIPGILRLGHKMLIAGPSKAGKSFLLIGLAIAIAEGGEWLGMKCRQGRVSYINLELDRPSCLDRFKEVYDRLGIKPEHINNLNVWNLRGKSVPMNKLSQIIIHRFKDRNYSAVIIDPIYKVITGDENNATEMSQFCSYFDQIATELDASVIYCHHHSKGASSKYSNAADRSSGSGVFARDPDAILDMRELKTDGIESKYREAHPDACNVLTAWEVRGTLREFAPMAPKRVWFDHPVHVPDTENFLAIANFNDSAGSGRGTGKEQKQKTDWFETVEELLAVTLDSAVTLEQVGISEANAKKKFGPGTDYEVATLGEVKVVHPRSENEIMYMHKLYRREKAGKGDRWRPSSE
jgi:RecA-family ATPase